MDFVGGEETFPSIKYGSQYEILRGTISPISLPLHINLSCEWFLTDYPCAICCMVFLQQIPSCNHRLNISLTRSLLASEPYFWNVPYYKEKRENLANKIQCGKETDWRLEVMKAEEKEE